MHYIRPYIKLTMKEVEEPIVRYIMRLWLSNFDYEEDHFYQMRYLIQYLYSKDNPNPELQN